MCFGADSKLLRTITLVLTIFLVTCFVLFVLLTASQVAHAGFEFCMSESNGPSVTKRQTNTASVTQRQFTSCTVAYNDPNQVNNHTGAGSYLSFYAKVGGDCV